MPVTVKTLIKMKDLNGNPVVLHQPKQAFQELLKATTVEGKEVLIDKKEAYITSSDVEIVCDGPNCAGNPKTISWNQELAGEDESHLPDDAYRIITLELFNGEKKVFCGVACAQGFLSKHVPLKSFREVNNVINIANSPKFQKMDK